MDIRTLGEQCHDALVAAAESKNIAMLLRKKAERILDQVFLMSDGSIEVRKATARDSKEHREADQRALEAETKANIAKAEGDGLQIRFEEWRTQQSTRRAEMTLR